MKKNKDDNIKECNDCGKNRMKRKVSKKTLKIKCDKLWSEIIKLRDNNKCRYCGKSGTNSHHIIARDNLHLRYDLRNGISLCSGHHVFNNESAHKNPIFFFDFLDSTIPDVVEYLRKEQNILEPNFQYNEKIIELQKSLDLYT